jgi:hypothetical protein
MRFKSPTQPLCRYCGKKIPKYTTTTYFGSIGRPSIGGRLPHFPHDKAEAQKLVNEKIVSVRYSRYTPSQYVSLPSEPEHDYINWVGTWDGETYWDEFFCRQPCAVNFAYTCVRAGHHSKAYAKAKADAA